MLAAHSPQPLKVERHRQIIRDALTPHQSPAEVQIEDPFAAPTDDEFFAAEASRERIESDSIDKLLCAAHSPRGLAPRVASNVRKAALSRMVDSRQPKNKAYWLVLSATTSVAVSALWWYSSFWQLINKANVDREAHVTLVQSRTTGSLFSQPFNASTNSERIDKIATVRQKELRNNRFALWGLP